VSRPSKPEDLRAPAAPTDDDAALVRRAQDGDYAAFAQIVVKYQNRVYALALRITGRAADAEEVAQGTFLAVTEHLADFRGDSKFSTWLYRVAANRALKAIRTRNRRGAEVTDDESLAALSLPEHVAPWSASPETLAARAETRRILERALEEIDEVHRAVFLLRDVEGLSTDETAEALGLTVANVKVRLMRARLKLREKLTREFGNAGAAIATHDHGD
jgi:RNA polymerase sigma-70 factor (ECF subfamily)